MEAATQVRSGSCRWLGGPTAEDLAEGTALLRIVTEKGVETVCWVFHTSRHTRIQKQDGTVYVLKLEAGVCSCPDHRNRGVTCKHVNALRAALPKIAA